jgi:hypothetical protein
MPTTITLDGARRGGLWNTIKTTLGPRGRGMGALQPWALGPGQDDRGKWLTGGAMAGPVGDVWSDDTSADGGSAVADFTVAAVGWGVLAFAVGTAALRGYAAVKKLV